MNISASPEATEFVRAHGGRLFVWAGTACCGGTRFVESSTDSPIHEEGFIRVDGPSFAVYVREAGGRLPEELEVRVRGRRRPRVEAFWNGCAFVV